MERIAQKLKNALYESLDDMVSDFVLMFDNACKYNEPDSQIYKVNKALFSTLDIKPTSKNGQREAIISLQYIFDDKFISCNIILYA